VKYGNGGIPLTLGTSYTEFSPNTNAMRFPGFERKQEISHGDHKPSRAEPTPNDDLALSLIVVTPDEKFHLTLYEIARACDWRITRVASVDEVGMLVWAKPTPMVIYDRDSTDEEWHDAVRRLGELPAQPCVLLASQVADSYLLAEVVRNHGYDILAKSVTAEKLTQCLRFAWSWARSRARGLGSGH
jgi:hypothetical protein